MPGRRGRFVLLHAGKRAGDDAFAWLKAHDTQGVSGLVRRKADGFANGEIFWNVIAWHGWMMVKSERHVVHDLFICCGSRRRSGL